MHQLTYRLLAILVALFSFSGIFAQDALFSQFYAAPLYLNPALAGKSDCGELRLAYRNHYPALSQAFVTYRAAYEQPFGQGRNVIAATLMNDVQGSGALSSLSGGLTYGFRFQLSRKAFLKTALQAEYVERHLNWEQLIFPDMIPATGNELLPTGEMPADFSERLIDFNAGLLFHTENYYVGVGVHHLMGGQLLSDAHPGTLPPRYSLHFGADVPLSGAPGSPVFSPNAIVQYQETAFAHYGFYLKTSYFSFGILTRHDFNLTFDAIIFGVGFQYQQIKIAYSYDWPILSAKKQTFGAHEISFGMNFACNNQKGKRQAVPCPAY